MSVVEEFLTQEALAVAGVSRSASGYGYRVWRHLRDKGIRAYAINPGNGVVGGVPRGGNSAGVDAARPRERRGDRAREEKRTGRRRQAMYVDDLSRMRVADRMWMFPLA